MLFRFGIGPLNIFFQFLSHGSIKYKVVGKSKYKVGMIMSDVEFYILLIALSIRHGSLVALFDFVLPSKNQYLWSKTGKVNHYCMIKMRTQRCLTHSSELVTILQNTFPPWITYSFIMGKFLECRLLQVSRETHGSSDGPLYCVIFDPIRKRI